MSRSKSDEPFTGVAVFCADVPPDPPTTVEPMAPEQDPPEDASDAPTDKSPPPVFETPPSLAMWDEPASKNRRALPKTAIGVAIAALLLLLLPFVTRHRTRGREEAATSTLPEDLVISERDLRNRVEVTADDFRSNGRAEARTDAPAPTFDEAESTMADRRKARAQDPEDLVAQRGKPSARPSGGGSTDFESGYQRPYVYFEHGAAASSTGATGTIAPAGTVVSAVLASPVDLRGGPSTIVALADSDGPIAKASRFVGSATSSADGRLALRFERLLLADGREARIQGEAQDGSGAFGIDGVVTSDGSSGAGAAARDLARDTASDVASETLGTFTGGIGGRLLRRAVDRASSRRGAPSVASHRVSLPAGTRFQIFLHQAVSIRG